MKKFGPLRSSTTGTHLGFAPQKIICGWSQLIRNRSGEDLGRLSSLIISYIPYNRKTGTFRVLQSKEEGFSNTILETRIEEAEVVNTVKSVPCFLEQRWTPRCSLISWVQRWNQKFGTRNSAVGRAHLVLAGRHLHGPWGGRLLGAHEYEFLKFFFYNFYLKFWALFSCILG